MAHEYSRAKLTRAQTKRNAWYMAAGDNIEMAGSMVIEKLSDADSLSERFARSDKDEVLEIMYRATRDLDRVIRRME